MFNKGQVAAGLLVLLVGGSILVWAAYAFFIALYQANPSTQAAIIAGLVAIFSLVFTFWKERSRSLREAHRDKKIEIYSQFFQIMFDMLERSKIGSLKADEVDPDLVKPLMKVSQGVLFYGSPSVVVAFSNFRNTSADGGGANSVVILKNIGKMLLAMREDIGLSNRGLDEVSIHQIYVSDDLRTLIARPSK